jgi:hypothetical protein
MKAARNLSGAGRNAQVETSPVIRFDMRADEMLRTTARKGYEIAKRLKDVGLKFKKIIPASTDGTVRDQFKLPLDSDAICVEISMVNKTDEEKPHQLTNEEKVVIIGQVNPLIDNIMDKKAQVLGILRS